MAEGWQGDSVAGSAGGPRGFSLVSSIPPTSSFHLKPHFIFHMSSRLVSPQIKLDPIIKPDSTTNCAFTYRVKCQFPQVVTRALQDPTSIPFSCFSCGLSQPPSQHTPCSHRSRGRALHISVCCIYAALIAGTFQ